MGDESSASGSRQPAGGATELQLGAASEEHREFVRRLSAEVFSRFGDYERSLPATMGLPGIRTVIAETDGAAVGFAMYSEDLLELGEIELLAIAVDPAWQSRGVGRALLQYVEAQARELVAPGRTATILLTVAHDNTRARALFDRSGYAPLPGETGTYPGGQTSMDLRKRLTE